MGRTLQTIGILNQIVLFDAVGAVVDERLALGVLGGHDPAPPMPALSLDEHIRSRGLSLRKPRSSKCELSCFRSKGSESQQRRLLILVVRGIGITE